MLGNCLKVLQSMLSNLVDLVVTSPPYADSRKTTYGGINPDSYVDWFLPIGQELKRVLKDDWTFILNIKEKAEIKVYIWNNLKTKLEIEDAKVNLIVNH